MNIVAVKVNPYQPEEANSVTIPVAVPDLADVRVLANRLHVIGEEFSGTFWGWPVQYDPELEEEAAKFQIPEQTGAIEQRSGHFGVPLVLPLAKVGFGSFLCFGKMVLINRPLNS